MALHLLESKELVELLIKTTANKLTMTQWNIMEFTLLDLTKTNYGAIIMAINYF